MIDKLHSIAIQHGITEFIKVEKGDVLCVNNGEDSYINQSYICGNDRIEIGIYENIEFMVASFFHELGHITDNEDGMYNSEEVAWEVGFRLANEYGYTFSEETISWCNDQLKTYI